MKKTFIFIFVISFSVVSVFAQTNHKSNLQLQAKDVPLQYNKRLLSKTLQRAYSRGGSGWFSYIQAIDNYVGGVSQLNETYLFPDSNITAIYGSGSTETAGTPFVHSIATVLDPKSQVFQQIYGTNLPQFTANNSYTLDSVEFFFGYVRNYPVAANVDTLLLTVFDNSPSKGHQNNLEEFYFSGPSMEADFGVDTVRFKDVPYNYLNHSPLPFVTGAVQVKIPLDANFAANDSVPGGAYMAKISTSALGTIDANSLVAVTASFLPGYSYSLADTLNNMNYVMISSLDENGVGTYPVYNPGDYNESYIIDNDVQYNNNANGFDSIYIPTLAFTAAYTYEDHDFSFLLDCQACDSTSSNNNCFASFTYSMNGNTVSFNSSGSSGAVTYSWDFGDGNTSNQADPVYTYSKPGIYNVCLVINNGVNCSNATCSYLNVGISNSPSCSVTFDIFPTSQPHVWDIVYDANGAAPIAYSWSWGDGSTSVGDTLSHTYSGPGNYKICLTITDDTLCTSTYCDSSTYIYRMENSNDVITMKAVNLSSLATGTQTVNAASANLAVIPNPCTNCEIKGVDNANDLLVTDLLGRNAGVSFTKTSGGYQLNLPDDRTGFFIVKNVKTGEVVKFIKE